MARTKHTVRKSKDLTTPNGGIKKSKKRRRQSNVIVDESYNGNTVTGKKIEKDTSVVEFVHEYFREHPQAGSVIRFRGLNKKEYYSLYEDKHIDKRYYCLEDWEHSTNTENIEQWSVVLGRDYDSVGQVAFPKWKITGKGKKKTKVEEVYVLFRLQNNNQVLHSNQILLNHNQALLNNNQGLLNNNQGLLKNNQGLLNNNQALLNNNQGLLNHNDFWKMECLMVSRSLSVCINKAFELCTQYKKEDLNVENKLDGTMCIRYWNRDIKEVVNIYVEKKIIDQDQDLFDDTQNFYLSDHKSNTTVLSYFLFIRTGKKLSPLS